MSLTLIKRGIPQVRTRYSLKHLSCVRFIFNGENPTRKTILPGKRTNNIDCWVYIYQYFQYVNDLCHVDENVGVLIFSSIKLNAGSICSMNTDWSVPIFFTYITQFIFMLYDADHDSIILAYIQFHTYLLVQLQDKRTQSIDYITTCWCLLYILNKWTTTFMVLTGY